MDQIGGKQLRDLVDLGHSGALALHGGADRFGGIHGSSGLGLHLGDLFRVLRPELFDGHRVSSFFTAGTIVRRFCICLSRGVCLGCDRGDAVGSEHPGSEVDLPSGDEQVSAVRAGGDRDGLVFQKLIDEALGLGFSARHVGGIRHHVHEHGVGQAGLALVALDLHLVPGVVLVRGLAQLVGVVAAQHQRPALVDHDQTAGVGLDGIGGAHDDAAAAHGHAVHDAGQLRAVPGELPEAVMDRQTDAGVAAVAVHADGDVLAALDLLQVFEDGEYGYYTDNNTNFVAFA